MGDANVWRALAAARERTARRLVLTHHGGIWYCFLRSVCLWTARHGEYAEAKLAHLFAGSSCIRRARR